MLFANAPGPRRSFPARVQHQGDVIVSGCVGRIQFERFSQMHKSFIQSSLLCQHEAKIVVCLAVLWSDLQRLPPIGHGGVILTLAGQLHRAAEQPIKIGGRHFDLHQIARRDVHEFGDVHRPVGGRSVLDPDRRAVSALLVQVRQEHLRIG